MIRQGHLLAGIVHAHATFEQRFAQRRPTVANLRVPDVRMVAVAVSVPVAQADGSSKAVSSLCPAMVARASHEKVGDKRGNRMLVADASGNEFLVGGEEDQQLHTAVSMMTQLSSIGILRRQPLAGMSCGALLPYVMGHEHM